ncbi:MAG: hypothetical protein BGO69_13750 [Bacteroidetes bacterium 46-16]|nr:MAG: hypothetical protein BGO69_13750 [Bacteroidetes bacterium 46-16]
MRILLIVLLFTCLSACNKFTKKTCSRPFISGVKISNTDTSYQKVIFYSYPKGSNFSGAHGSFSNIDIIDGRVNFDMDPARDWELEIKPNGKICRIKEINMETGSAHVENGQICVVGFSYTLDDTAHHIDGYTTAEIDPKDFYIPIY